MELELHSTSGGPIIDGYGKDYITISGNKVKNNFILLPDKLHEINNESVSSIINLIKKYQNKIDLLLYGYSKQNINKDLLDKIKNIKLSVEVMNNLAACRTWSVLVGEGRAVGALIFIK